MAQEGACSIVVPPSEVQVPGLMYAVGNIMAFSDDGTRGIVTVNGTNKFVMFNKNECYFMGKLFHYFKNLYDTFRKGTQIHILMRDLGEYRAVATFRVRYHAVLSWVGNRLPYVSITAVKNVHLLESYEAKENTPPISNMTFDIPVDVPIRDLLVKEGNVYWCSDNYGLISVPRHHGPPEKVLFTPQVLFINGYKFPSRENFPVICAANRFYLYVKRILPRQIFGAHVAMEAVFVWRGEKPNIRMVYHPELPMERNGYHIDKKPLAYNAMNKNPSPTNIKHKTEYYKETSVMNESEYNYISSQKTMDDSKEVQEEKSSNNIVSQVPRYMTGVYHGIHNGYLIYGSQDRAVRFLFENFYTEEADIKSMSQLTNYIMKINKSMPLFHGYVLPLQSPVRYGQYTVTWEGSYVWYGQAPLNLKETIRAVLKAANKSSDVQPSEQMIDRSKLMVCDEPIIIDKSIRRGRVSGYVLTAANSDAIVIGFCNTVYLTRERFYVNGKKFRGTSLLDYFKKNNEKVFTYLVPMVPCKKYGCVIDSKAVCAWVGKEPDELQRLINNEKKITNRDISEIGYSKTEKNCLYYFVGKVQKLGERRGIIECDNNSIKVGFSMDELYKHGKKVNEQSIMSLHMKLLLTSRWSVLAYYTEEESIPGVNHYAVAVFHHDNQAKLFDELQNKIPLWLKKIDNGGVCQCRAQLNKLLKKPFSYSAIGSFMERQNDEIAFGVKDKGLVWLSTDKVWMDNCSCYFSTADEQRFCHIVFAEDQETPIFAWAGNAPDLTRSHDNDDIASDDEDDNIGHDEEKYFEDVYEEESEDTSSDDEDDECDIDDACDPYNLVEITLKNSFAPLLPTNRKNKNKTRKDPSKVRDICGKHALGTIVDITNEGVIISWQSIEYNATIFVILNLNYLFVDTSPYNKLNPGRIETSDNFKGSQLNMYVNTLSKPMMVGLLEISVQATAGWIGSKPIFMPPPGKQKPGKFEISHLRIAYSQFEGATLQFCSLKFWKNYLKKQQENQRHREKADEQQMHQKKSQVIGTKVKKVVVKQQKTNDQNLANKMSEISINNSSSPTPSPARRTSPLHQPRVSTTFTSTQILQSICPPPSSSDAIVAALHTDVFASHGFCSSSQQNQAHTSDLVVTQQQPALRNTPSPVMANAAQTVTASYAEPTATATDMTGTINELHPSLGCIAAEDGNLYYFTPDKFFLHGVPLTGCELYCVLLQGMQVQYKLDGDGRLEEAWYKCRKVSNHGETAMFLYKWSEDNLVPDETRNALLLTLTRL